MTKLSVFAAAIAMAMGFLCLAPSPVSGQGVANPPSGPALPAPPVAAPPVAPGGQLPMMKHDLPVQCVPDKDGVVWRIQCDESTRVCLYALNRELDSRGNPQKSLERARRCSPTVDITRDSLVARGYTLAPGRVDAPYGWTRDDRGRVFQINFDLKRRLYIGSAYGPALARRTGEVDERDTKRSTIDFGLLVFEHYTGKDNASRHRVRLVEGEIAVAPFSADMALVHYDVSHRYKKPLLRLTTFFGDPRRHDLYLNLGFWFEGLRLESHQNNVADSNLWKFASAQGTLDLLQSEKMDSYVRLRSGFGIERLYSDGVADRGAVTLATALEWDWVVDRAGFHNLHGALVYEAPRFFERQVDVGLTARRMRAEAAYEAVVVAINDQPLTARLAAKVEKRDDIPGLEDRWALVATAGLRFSLWAPPKRN